MLSNYFNITVIAEWLVFFAAIFLLNRDTGKWRLFIILLFLTLCAESTGWYISNILKKSNNSTVFNFLLIINISFFGWMLTKAEPFKKAKLTITIAIVAFILIAIANLFFIQGLWIYNSYTEMIGDVMLAIICCYFFYVMINETNFRDLLKYEYFWLSTGVLFSSLGGIILYMFLNLLQTYKKQTGINVYGYINYAINLLLYGSLIVAFICRRMITKSK